MGPFNLSGNYTSSWYGDYADFVSLSSPWFIRGGSCFNTNVAGIFAFSGTTGGIVSTYSFRVVINK